LKRSAKRRLERCAVALAKADRPKPPSECWQANAKIDCPERACDRKRQNPVEITGQKMAQMENEKSALAFANFSGIFNGEGVETCT